MRQLRETARDLQLIRPSIHQSEASIFTLSVRAAARLGFLVQRIDASDVEKFEAPNSDFLEEIYNDWRAALTAWERIDAIAPATPPDEGEHWNMDTKLFNSNTLVLISMFKSDIQNSFIEVRNIVLGNNGEIDGDGRFTGTTPEANKEALLKLVTTTLDNIIVLMAVIEKDWTGRNSFVPQP